MNIRIGFFDSGIGGISYLNSLRDMLSKSRVHENLPFTHYSLFYLADTEGFPYGEKTSTYLKKRILHIVPKFVAELQLDVLILACNTASMLMIDSLRNVIRKPIIGVVPAIKPAVMQGARKILVMNTTISIHSTYMKALTIKLLQDHAANSKIFIKGCQALINAIEDMITSDDTVYYDNTIRELNKIANKIKKLQCEAVVLGCTHFLHIKNMLINLLPHSVVVIDSLEGVTNRIADVVTQHGLARVAHTHKEKNYVHHDAHTTPPTIHTSFYYTREHNKERYTYLCNTYDLKFQGIL